ncbi:hypothetical protein [Buchnera aphidicola]|uniref:hypothetical protein n=1 Tax=Buchnera aphidicola TaxID=9 RepID=UPI0031B80C4E
MQQFILKKKNIKNKKNIILVHGWGINKKIWNKLIKFFKKKYNVTIIEICEFIEKFNLYEKSFYYITNLMYKIFNNNSIWIGWSIGGLFVEQIGVNKKNIIITICSSPCFFKKKIWPGLNKKKIINMMKKLLKNYKITIENFFLEQSIQKKHKNIFFHNTKIPNNKSLKKCFITILKTYIKNKKYKKNTKIFRIYGEFDKITKQETYKKIFIKKNNRYFIIKKSGHIPFLTHTNILYKIIKYIIK